MRRPPSLARSPPKPQAAARLKAATQDAPAVTPLLAPAVFSAQHPLPQPVGADDRLPVGRPAYRRVARARGVKAVLGAASLAA